MSRVMNEGVLPDGTRFAVVIGPRRRRQLDDWERTAFPHKRGSKGGTWVNRRTGWIITMESHPTCFRPYLVWRPDGVCLRPGLKFHFLHEAKAAADEAAR